ncbi:MAG: Rieske (2Fe-2S) protein [Chitinophagaceae bacterium]|nr:Rieske (2Fe-2S) protein [Chitinophagaceae bacterium]MCB9045004.1 Rieske (2Fe-2S) protein [Chitinophagales bacterium]
MIYNWQIVKTVSLSNLEDNKPIEISVDTKAVGLLRKGDDIYAFAATCPHAGARLCEGWVDAQGRIVCPLHKYRFDPANGRNTSGEGYKLKTYPVEIRNGAIYIGLW